MDIEHNIEQIRRRVSHKDYAGSIGAQFFQNLCASGPEVVIGFCEKLALFGSKAELTEIEQQALDDAAELCSAKSQLEDLPKLRPTRRRFLMIAGGLGVFALDAATAYFFMNGSPLATKIEQKKAEEVANEIVAELLKKPAINPRDFKQTVEEKLQELQKQNRLQSNDAQRLALIVGGLVLAGYMTNLLTKSSLAEIELKSKTDGIISQFDEFCRTRIAAEQTQSFAR